MPLRRVVLVLAVVCLGCDGESENAGPQMGGTDPGAPEDSGSTSGGEDDDPTGDDPSTTGAPATTGDDPPPPETTGGEDPMDDPMGSSGCGAASVYEAGTHARITVDVGGTAREYTLFVPPGYDPNAPTTLVVNFHGLLGSPSQQADFSQFNNTAAERGLLVAYPAGIGASFNAGVCCGQASSNNVDDVGFSRALVADVSAKMCVNSKRVHATGMSNGGHMAHRLACEAADVFASAASVTGVLNVAGCSPSRPISMIQFHGTSDNIVSYNGVPPVEPMMENWAARNGCSATSEVTFSQGDTVCRSWPDCDAGVEVSLCTVDGGGHCWPGNSSCIFGDSTTELHASEVIADMFADQPLP